MISQSHRALTDTKAVTERARKLRSQYSVQAQSLRARIEMRVNRIPAALRKANIGELYMKYEELNDKEEAVASVSQGPARTEQEKHHVTAAPAKGRSKKRNRYVARIIQTNHAYK